MGIDAKALADEYQKGKQLGDQKIIDDVFNQLLDLKKQRDANPLNCDGIYHNALVRFGEECRKRKLLPDLQIIDVSSGHEFVVMNDMYDVSRLNDRGNPVVPGSPEQLQFRQKQLAEQKQQLLKNQENLTREENRMHVEKDSVSHDQNVLLNDLVRSEAPWRAATYANKLANGLEKSQAWNDPLALHLAMGELWSYSKRLSRNTHGALEQKIILDRLNLELKQRGLLPENLRVIDVSNNMTFVVRDQKGTTGTMNDKGEISSSTPGKALEPGKSRLRSVLDPQTRAELQAQEELNIQQQMARTQPELQQRQAELRTRQEQVQHMENQVRLERERNLSELERIRAEEERVKAELERNRRK